MTAYALIDQNGNVVNMIEWDGSSSWLAPSGLTAIVATGTSIIGGTYSNGEFIVPVVAQTQMGS